MIQNTQRIPKVIHYFWFGKNPESDLIKKCISSWRKYNPDYEIKRWDESNFNIDISVDYVKEAYLAKKWAFVSDYARFYVLNKYGGIYLDTDVEVLKSLDPIIDKGPFLALEHDNYDSIAPGLGMASLPNNVLLEKMLKDYKNRHFKKDNGFYDETPVGVRMTEEFLLKDGLKKVSGIQKIDGFWIYPKEYFCPLDFQTGETNITENTYAIHHYASSWWDEKDKKYWKIAQKLTPMFGASKANKIQRIIKAPYTIKKRIKQAGIMNTIKYYKDKFKGDN